MLNEIFKKFLASPMTIFVYGILSKWYLMIGLAGMVVAYWVFKGLNDLGLIKAAEDIVFRALNDAKSVAKYCVPKIMNLQSFWECINSPPEYIPTEAEKLFESEVNDTISNITSDKNLKLPSSENPYE